MKVSVITPIKADTPQKVKWLLRAINSVKAQDYDDWEMVIVNDRSSVKFGDFPELVEALQEGDRIKGLKTATHGVSAARNTAAEAASGECLLPLDADDTLPPYAISTFVEEWEKKPGGILYGHTMMFQNDAQRLIAAKPYSFGSLMHGLLFPVGAFHGKADWEKVGGWKTEMDGGLEDWEYWLSMGEAGVCGRRIEKVMYFYRRHANSRLSWIRSQPGKYDEAYQKMRSLHSESFAGRLPVGCCGPAGPSKRPKAKASKGGGSAGALQKALSKIDTGTLVNIIYVGRLAGGFGVNGKSSGLHYDVMGPGMGLRMPDGRIGVDPRDAAQVLRLERGQAFEVRKA